jgi:hypothetical protein
MADSLAAAARKAAAVVADSRAAVVHKAAAAGMAVAAGRRIESADCNRAAVPAEGLRPEDIAVTLKSILSLSRLTEEIYLLKSSYLKRYLSHSARLSDGPSLYEHRVPVYREMMDGPETRPA